jgi:SAM-dependent methyltransferase
VNFPFKKYIPFWLGKKLRGALQKVSALFYSGTAVHCPYCQKSFSKFLPGGFDLPVLFEKEVVGAGYRTNNVCPRCYSLDRDRLIYLFLQEKTNMFSAKLSVFHVAPEGCIRALLTDLPNISYHAGVKYLEGYYYDRKTNLIDITNAPFGDDEFDVIICNHVLEHIPEDRKAMREIYRMLKPGGWAILQVPISKILKETFEDPSIVKPEDRERVFGQFDHVRIYGQDYQSRLENAGFIVKTHNPYRDKWPVDLKKFAINPDENLYIAYK